MCEIEASKSKISSFILRIEKYNVWKKLCMHNALLNKMHKLLIICKQK